MKRIARTISLATLFLTNWGLAHAADLGVEPAIETVQPAERAFYVRGDFGYAFNKIGGFSQPEVLDNGGSFVSSDVGHAPYIGAGIGWRFTNWLRFDLTGEYRFSADATAQDYLQTNLHGPDGQLTASTKYSGEFTSIVGLANVYFDLPEWHGITPYVGGGIGFARNTFSDFATSSHGTFLDFSTSKLTTQDTTGFANDKSEISFAWALMAGLSIDVSSRAKLDLGYRYVNLGGKIAISSNIINCVCGTVASPLTGDDLESHEIRVGLRFELGSADEQRYEPLK